MDTIRAQERLDAAFAELEQRNIIARPNFMCCNGCACSAMDEEREGWITAGKGEPFGAIHFHEQSTESANAGYKLWLNHGSFADTKELNQRVADAVVEVLTEHGFVVDWDGDLYRKIAIEKPDGGWNLRYPRYL